MTAQIPSGKQVGYVCENGHINESHAVNHAAEPGEKCVCEECGTLVRKTLIDA
jgi:hypothetical protein